MLLPMNPYAFDAISRTGGVKKYARKVVKTSATEPVKAGDGGLVDSDYEPAYKSHNRRMKQRDRRLAKGRRGHRENRLYDTRSGIERRRLNRRANTTGERPKTGLDMTV